MNEIKQRREQQIRSLACSWPGRNHIASARSYSRALLMSSAALSMRALRMAERGMETCSEMEEKGGLSLSAAEQDIGHNSRQRETMESTTTCVQLTQNMHHLPNPQYTEYTFIFLKHWLFIFCFSAVLDCHWALILIFYLSIRPCISWQLLTLSACSFFQMFNFTRPHRNWAFEH